MCLMFVLIEIKSRCFIRDSKKELINTIIKTLVRGCSRWSSASLQDKSPIVAVLHGNYGAGYLWALRDIFTDEQIKDATGLNVVEFQRKITDIQDKATKQLVTVCPAYASNLDKELAIIAGES